VVSVSWTKEADITVCTVQLWFLSAVPVLLSMTQLRAFLLDAKRDREHASNIPTYAIKDELVLSVFGFSTVACILCLHCLRVMVPTVSRGEHHNAISKFVATEWRDVGRLNSPKFLVRYHLPDVASAFYIRGTHNDMATRTTSCDPRRFRE
jgi:hypothetical protein